MPDEYSSIFSEDPRSGLLPYSQLQARRAIAVALATRNRPYPKTIGEGLTALGEGIGEGMYNNNLAGAEAAQQRYNRGIAPYLSGLGTATPRPSGGASLENTDPATQAFAYAPPDTGPVFDPSKLSPEDRQKLEQARAYSGPQMPIEEWKQRIARNESGSRKDAYTLVGERSRRGDYPYGKYQVMGENIPKWTRAYYGKELTPEEFLANPEAQERVADGQGGKYLSKYGPEGAGAAWFAGEKGMNDPNRKDTLGTHVAEYKRRFNIPLVSRDQVVASAARAAPDPESAAPYQVASLGDGVQTRETVVPDPREAVAQTLAGPPPQQVAQAGQVIGPAPPPVPPNAVPAELTPQAVPPAPAQPVRPTEPGPRPEPGDYIRANPQLAQQILKLKQIEADPRTQPEHAALARDAINKIEQRANEADTRAFTIWHEDTKTKKAFELSKEKQDIEIAKARGEAYDAAEKRVITQRLGGRDPEAFFKEFNVERGAAAMQANTLRQAQIAKEAISNGIISGFGANAKLDMAKLQAWMFNNKAKGNLASNSEIMLNALRSTLGTAVQNVQGQTDSRGITDTDIKIASGTIAADPNLQLRTINKIIESTASLARTKLGDYEDKRDYYLSGTRAERAYHFPVPDTAPRPYLDTLIKNNTVETRAEFDKRFGEGAAQLEIARAKRRERRGE